MKDELITKLKDGIDYMNKYDISMDTCNMDLQEGILLSGNEAEFILTALEQEPTKDNYCICGDQQDIEDILGAGNPRVRCNHCGQLIKTEQGSKEQKIKDKCHKIYDKVKEAMTPDKRTFEQAEQEGKEQSAEAYLPIWLKEYYEDDSTEMSGWRDEEVIDFANKYAQQSRKEDLIKYEIAQNTVGGKLHGSKERIIECIDNYLNLKT